MQKRILSPFRIVLGELLWNHRIDHCGTDDEAIDLLISNDNIFILSQAISDQDLLIGIITRLSVNSGEVFRQELPGISGWNFRPECLDAATDETLYVAATEYQGGNSSGVIISFNESGSVNWRYVSSENPHDELASVTALAVNDSYIAVGGTIPGSGISQKVGITLLNSSGQFNWQEQYQGNSGYLDELNDLAFRYDSAVVFAATVYNNGYNRDILAGCYATDGSLLWLDELNGSGNNNDLAYGLSINSSGETFLFGRTFRGSEGNDITLLKYDFAGNRIGEWPFSTAPLFNDDLYAWTIGSDGILIAAHSPGNMVQLLELDFDGQLLDQFSVDLDTESHQSVHSLYRLMSEEIIIGGSISLGSWSALAIASVRSEPTGISATNFPKDFSLKQNYPNPFNPTTQIEFSISSASTVYLEVFNSLGETVTMLANKQFAPGTHQLTWQAEEYASGLYFYRMRVGAKAITKRMLLLR